MYEYFDQKDFSGNPIKRQSSVLYFNLASNIGLAQYMNIRKNYVTLEDSILSSIFNNRHFEFFDYDISL